jgi:hypothetical protein
LNVAEKNVKASNNDLVAQKSSTDRNHGTVVSKDVREESPRARRIESKAKYSTIQKDFHRDDNVNTTSSDIRNKGNDEDSTGRKDDTVINTNSSRTSIRSEPIVTTSPRSMNFKIDQQDQNVELKDQSLVPKYKSNSSPSLNRQIEHQIQPSAINHINTNFNSNNSKKYVNKNTDVLLTSITEQLQENIGTLQQLEEKLGTSHKAAEDSLLKKNDMFYSKLEQSVAEIKNQHEDDTQELHDVTHKINDIMTFMMDHFKNESDTLTQKQLELTNLQVGM